MSPDAATLQPKTDAARIHSDRVGPSFNILLEPPFRYGPAAARTDGGGRCRRRACSRRLGPAITPREAQRAAISATVVSSIRLLKPHSLSYQLDTFTRRPDTFVSVESKIDERGSWLKSLETSGAVL